MNPQVADIPIAHPDLESAQKKEKHEDDFSSYAPDEKPDFTAPQYQDPFGNEEDAEVKYKILKWW